MQQQQQHTLTEHLPFECGRILTQRTLTILVQTHRRNSQRTHLPSANTHTHTHMLSTLIISVQAHTLAEHSPSEGKCTHTLTLHSPFEYTHTVNLPSECTHTTECNRHTHQQTQAHMNAETTHGVSKQHQHTEMYAHSLQHRKWRIKNPCHMHAGIPLQKFQPNQERNYNEKYFE